MDELKAWAITICTVAVLSALLNMLVPERRFEKVLRLCMGAFVLLVCIMPLDGFVDCGRRVSDISESNVELGSDLCRRVEEQTEKAAESTVKSLVMAQLEKIGCHDSNVDVRMDIDDNGCISIGQVTVTLAKGQRTDGEKVRSCISEALGIDVCVEASG